MRFTDFLFFLPRIWYGWRDKKLAKKIEGWLTELLLDEYQSIPWQAFTALSFLQKDSDKSNKFYPGNTEPVKLAKLSAFFPEIPLAIDLINESYLDHHPTQHSHKDWVDIGESVNSKSTILTNYYCLYKIFYYNSVTRKKDLKRFLDSLLG